MVNVPGRSKGCNTCRRRKKGCEGYARSTIFVSHEPQTQAGSTKVAAVRPKASKGLRRESKDSTSGTSHDEGAIAAGVAKAKAAASTSNSLVPLREDLTRASYQHNLFGQFWDSYLPRTFLLSSTTGPNGNVSHAWADDILRLAERSLPLRQALSAVSLSCVGNREKDPLKIRHGAECYGAAVVKLNHLLRTSAAMTDDAIIPTCQLLSSYEQFNGFGSTKTHAQGRNWQAHISGVARVLQLRGPERHASGSSQSIFAYSRYAQLAYWIVVRKACPFDSDAWTSLPWSGKDKTLRDRVIDIVLPVPGILEQSDRATVKAASAPEGDNDKGVQQTRIRLIREMLDVHRKIQTWRADAATYVWESEAANAGKPVDWAEVDGDEYWMSHGTDVAASAITYWSMNVIVCSTLRALSAHLADPAYGVDTFAGDRLDPQPHATAIVANMKYFLHADAGLFGFQTISFPLFTALVYFAAFNAVEPEERAMIRDKLWGAAAIQPYGPMIGTFLEQLGEEESRRNGSEERARAMLQWDGDRERSLRWFNIRDGGRPKVHGPAPAPDFTGPTPPPGAFDRSAPPQSNGFGGTAPPPPPAAGGLIVSAAAGFTSPVATVAAPAENYVATQALVG